MINNYELPEKANDVKKEGQINLLNPYHQEPIGNYILRLNSYGIAKSDAISIVQSKMDVDKTKAQIITEKIYAKNVNVFGANLLEFQNNYTYEFNDDDWHLTPYIPNEAYSNLPKILREGTSLFSNKRESDMFLTSAIVVSSSLLTHIHGIYNGKRVFPNLYSYIIAPPAAGKDSVLYARKIGEVINNIRKKNNDFPTNLFIPGNSSSAAIYQQLNKNNGEGLLFESEADTLTQAIKQDWGGFSDILRTAYQHGTLSISRKNTDLVEIMNPKLSIVLTSTKDQVRRVIPSVDNGLFSRFIFYTFSIDTPFHVSNSVSYDEISEHIGVEFISYYNETIKIEKFDFTDKQWQIFNNRFHNLQNQAHSIYGDNSISIIRRHGLMLYRTAMILSVLRYAEKQLYLKTINPEYYEEKVALLECDDTDFNTAFLLIYTYLQHAFYIYGCMNKQSTEGIKNKFMLSFYKSLPNNTDFQRSKAIEIGKEMGFENRTIDKYISILHKKGMLLSPRYGIYKKISN